VTLQYVGSLPVSGLQVGLAASLGGIAAKISGLQELIVELQPSLAGKLEMSLTFPPNLPGLAASASGHLNPEAMAVLLNPATWFSGNVGLQGDIALKLGLGLAKIEIAIRLVDQLRAGFNAGGIAEWAYAGTAQGFGTGLSWELQSSTGGLDRDAQVSGLIIACEDGASWDSFGSGFNVGDPYPGAVQFVGSLTGGEIVTALRLPMLEIEAYLAEMQGSVVALRGQLDLSFGLNLPAPDELLSLGIAIDLDAAIGSLVEIDADITGEISIVLGKIDLLLQLQASIQASLSGGGLSVWRYSGPISAMGDELATTLEEGLPGGGGPSVSISGIALACATPSAWAAFGRLVPV
jgi:hypothetical protein